MVSAVITIFGITGDLAKRKLLPSLYHLIRKKEIDKVHILGVGRHKSSPKEILSGLNLKNPDKKIIKKMEDNLSFLQMDLSNTDYSSLRDELDVWAKKGMVNRLFYLAISPALFPSVSQGFKNSGLNEEKHGWVRIVFEKPFGRDEQTAKELNEVTKAVFKESQLYRIDHYLGKELVQNIAVLRFTNTFLEPIWNHRHIDHVQIILDESLGVEDRAEYYDKTGAVRDMVQSHMLQLLALVAMEAPARFNSQQIRNEKFKVLQSMREVSSDDCVFGQYDGYKKEKGVAKDSSTETFAAMKLFIDNLRWKDTPFYLKTGKKMKEKESLIYIQFEESPCQLFDKKVCELQPNHLVIRIHPEEGFFFMLNNKLPGKDAITQVKMDFCHECAFGTTSPEAYEVLLTHILAGDQSIFIRHDEVERSWNRLTEVLRKRKVHPYKEGTIPKEAKDLIEKDGRAWFK